MRRTARLLAGTALTVAATAPVHAMAATEPTAPGPAGRLDVRPATVTPGGQVTVHTAACGSPGTATGDAGALGAGTFPLAPGAEDSQATGRFRVPPSAQPGTYEIVARCAEGDRQVAGDLVVALSAAHAQVRPRGSVKTGVGGGLGPDPVQTTAGVAALAVAAAGGTWLLHRRARGDGI
ncbi:MULTISPECIES: hypothetical protein [unclassified Streptomyces]|uniref:hypothetical protein n=1 Tax=unclassified Streptomyces TaxID=2593676 RepID=UPI003407A2A9